MMPELGGLRSCNVRSSRVPPSEEVPGAIIDTAAFWNRYPKSSARSQKETGTHSCMWMSVNIGCVCQGIAARIKASHQFLRKDFHIRFYEQSDVIGLDGMNLHSALSQFPPAHGGIPSMMFALL